ncbi:bifunctional metallophosphatase/5'-nucleotidase [Thermoflavimicrobium daqui]|uniref:Bifunctional metallophosphatase/5'-nucleotidase n=2 Tax=Thermoflavimicrobium daqui TaxID=2137476 RepID=A0A364K855_9BACL|nr:bifunctional metallophosphatase/5'-nucleotidase [Thermoflavimicrobium daqui]
MVACGTLLSSITLLGCQPSTTQTEKTQTTHLTIMSTSDLHGYVTPIDYGTNKPADIGLAKIATLVKDVRKKNPEALLLDSGDTIQGSPLEYHHAYVDNKPIDPMMLTMNHLRYSAMAIGNHEYNYGPKIMEKAMKEAKFPWLSANTVKNGTSEVYTKPYQIIPMKNGVRVGVLGLTTQKVPNWERPDNIKHLDFHDVVETAKKWIPIMKEKEKADVIFVSYHGGLEHTKTKEGKIEASSQTDGENQVYQLATQVKGIDVILAGHMHTPIDDFRVNGVLITEPNKWGSHLSVVDLDLKKENNRWTVTNKKAKLLEAEKAKPDPEVLKLTQTYEQNTQKMLDEVIGQAEGDLTIKDHHSTRTHDTAIIELINRIQMEESGAKISSTALFNNEATGFPKNITLRNVLSTYVYSNTLQVLKVKGKDIKDALEQTATYFKQNSGNQPVEVNPKFISPKVQHYNYDMWEGIRYTIDVSKPEGSRIVELKDMDGNPIQMDKDYEVVMNNYRASGGGNYKMFAGKPVVKDIQVEMTDLITDYIRKHKTISAQVDHNWKVIGGKVD